MKIGAKLYSRSLFTAAFVVLIATNALVLYAVAANRLGSPESRLILTERELALPYWVNDENSGLSLQLKWRALPGDEQPHRYTNWRSPAWLDAQKLQELGFDLDRYRHRSGKGAARYKREVSKEVYILLELGGPSYRTALRSTENAMAAEAREFAKDYSDEDQLKKLERAETNLERERRGKSRLFAIDAGLDPVKLRTKYQDRHRFIITRGIVKPTRVEYEQPLKAIGTIKRLSIEKSHVPRNLRSFFEALPTAVDMGAGGKSPRYQVELAYGKRYEPWIMSVAPHVEKSAPMDDDLEKSGHEGDDA